MADKILIVDDDTNIRLGLQKILTERLEGPVEVTGLENGLQAAKLLEHSPVDVVVTDIKMPLYTGIDLLKFLAEKELECRAVVLSGYDDYNLVRDALRLGAVDYLLKPVDFDVLISTVKNLLSATRLKKQATGQVGGEDIDMQLLLEYFVAQAAMANSTVRQFASLHGLGEGTPCALAYVDIQGMPYSEHLVIKNLLAGQLEAFHNTLKGEDVITLHGMLGGYWVLLAFFRGADPHIRTLYPLFTELEKLQLRLSASAKLFPLREVAGERGRCRAGFDRYYFDLPCHPDRVENYEKQREELVGELVDAAGRYDQTGAIRALRELFALLGDARPGVQEVQKVLNNAVYSLLSRSPSYIPLVSGAKFTDYDAFKQIESADSLSALLKGMIDSFSCYIGQALQGLENKDDYIIQRAKEYILANYRDPITLGDVAAHVYLNPNYFSTLFKNKTDTTFRQYLRTLRVEKAKELIAGTNLKIYEIAHAVGYQESAHFIRAFKDVTGQSPSALRK